MRPDKPKSVTIDFDDGDPHLEPVAMSPLRVAQSWGPLGRRVPKLVKAPRPQAARR